MTAMLDLSNCDILQRFDSADETGPTPTLSSMRRAFDAIAELGEEVSEIRMGARAYAAYVGELNVLIAIGASTGTFDDVLSTPMFRDTSLHPTSIAVIPHPLQERGVAPANETQTPTGRFVTLTETKGDLITSREVYAENAEHVYELIAQRGRGECWDVSVMTSVTRGIDLASTILAEGAFAEAMLGALDLVRVYAAMGYDTSSLLEPDGLLGQLATLAAHEAIAADPPEGLVASTAEIIVALEALIPGVRPDLD